MLWVEERARARTEKTRAWLTSRKRRRSVRPEWGEVEMWVSDKDANLAGAGTLRSSARTASHSCDSGDST